MVFWKKTVFSMLQKAILNKSMPHPVAFAVALLLAVSGALINTSAFLLLGAWLMCFVWLALKGLTSIHLKFVVGAVLPLYLALLLVWVVIVEGAPPNPSLSGLEYANHMALQILFIGGIFQLVFVPLYNDGTLVQSLTICGLHRSIVIIFSSAIIIIEDVRLRARQVAEARIARGLLPTNLIGKVRQLASILGPLFVSMIDSSIKRAELWEHRKLHDRIASKPEVLFSHSYLQSSLVMGISVVWVSLCIWNRL